MKDSFILYTEYMEHIEILNMEQRGILITAIFNYNNGNELPKMDDVTKMAFSFIKKRLEKDAEKYEETISKRSEAGKKGGRPKKEEKQMVSDEENKKTKKANGFLGFSEKAKKADNDNVYVNVNDNDNKESVREKPTLEEIKSACKEHNIKLVNPEVFFNYYKAKQWIVKEKDISENWLDYLLLWESREKEKGKPKPRSDFSMKTDYDFEALEKELLGI